VDSRSGKYFDPDILNYPLAVFCAYSMKVEAYIPTHNVSPGVHGAAARS